MPGRKAAGHAPLADTVYHILLNQFMDGSRPPGEPLNIAVLSRELDVSQTPIREALARLERTGLVQREALKGYRVTAPLSESDLVALMDARVVIEPALAREAAKRTTPEFLATLRKTIEHLDQPPSGSNGGSSFPSYWLADEKFHVAIAEQAGNPFLAGAYSALGVQIQRIRHFSYTAAYAATEHRKIYAALEAGKPTLAAQLMRDHVRSAGARALKDRRSDGE